ncbi:hypothetical protein TCON_2489, partial [Astathelohania contejeani]
MELHKFAYMMFLLIYKLKPSHTSSSMLYLNAEMNLKNHDGVDLICKTLKICLRKIGLIISKYYNNAKDPCKQTLPFSEATKNLISCDIEYILSYLQNTSGNMKNEHSDFKFEEVDIITLKRLLLSLNLKIVNLTLILIYENTNIFLNHQFQNINLSFIGEFIIIKDILYKRHNFIFSNINDTAKSYYNLKKLLSNNIDDNTRKRYLLNTHIKLISNVKFWKILYNNVKLRNLVMIQIISIKLMFNDADDARTDITELPIQLLYSFKEISNLISCDI